MGKVPNSVTVVAPEKAPQSSICYLPSSQVTAVVKTSSEYQISWQLEEPAGQFVGEHRGRNSLRANWACGIQTRLSSHETISITMRWCNLTAWHYDTIACNLRHILQVISVRSWNIYFAGRRAPLWSSPDLLSAGQWGITLLKLIACVY